MAGQRQAQNCNHAFFLSSYSLLCYRLRGYRLWKVLTPSHAFSSCFWSALTMCTNKRIFTLQSFYNMFPMRLYITIVCFSYYLIYLANIFLYF